MLYFYLSNYLYNKEVFYMQLWQSVPGIVGTLQIPLTTHSAFACIICLQRGFFCPRFHTMLSTRLTEHFTLPAVPMRRDHGRDEEAMLA